MRREGISVGIERTLRYASTMGFFFTCPARAQEGAIHMTFYAEKREGERGCGD